MMIGRLSSRILEETYKGVSGYFYTAKDIADSGYCIGIPDAGTSSIPVQICDCEYVPDAYMEILEAESKGLISLIRYENQSQKKLEWIRKTVAQEYNNVFFYGYHPPLQQHI